FYILTRCSFDFAFIVIYNYWSNKKGLSTNYSFSIAMVYEVSYVRYSSLYAKYFYYFEGKKHYDKVILNGESKKSVLNKFFEIKISNESPFINEINFKKEITDFKKIKSFGF